MKLVAINTSPRVNWNTAQLVKEAARGAEDAGAQVEYFDLYRQDKFTGCISCFGCKLAPYEGKCIYKDGIAPILEAIRDADAVVIGTPNYLGQPSAGFRALYERIAFQNLTYRVEDRMYAPCTTPVLFIMTSNAPDEMYDNGPYGAMVQEYCSGLERGIGPAKAFIAGNTLQVADYSRFNWTMIDADMKKERHETVFPQEKQAVYELGAAMACGE